MRTGCGTATRSCPRILKTITFSPLLAINEPLLRGGGELVRCLNMTPDREFRFVIPKITVPVLLKFWDRDVELAPKLDTLIIEPDFRRFSLRGELESATGRKLNALRTVEVGPRLPRPRRSSGKRRFKSIAEFISWKRLRTPSGPFPRKV